MFIPKRSTGGCLTCKRRKKKCDEMKPYCRRCIQGDFQCLGYEPQADGCIRGSLYETEVVRQHPLTLINEDAIATSNSTLDHLIACSGVADEPQQPPESYSLIEKFVLGPSAPPRSFAIDSVLIDEATSFIMSQFVAFSQELLFKPPPSHIEQGLLWRIEYSEFTRWSMYLSARVLKDISNGINGQKYVGSIFRLYQQMLESPRSTGPVESMDGRLGGLHDLAYIGSIVSGMAVGYSLFQRCTPTFLQLAGFSPELWSNNSTISISKAVQSRYEIIKFVVHDTIIAVVLGMPPQLHYNTTLERDEEQPKRALELVYGISPEILCALGKVNAWRASRLMEESQSRGDRGDIEHTLGGWSPFVEHTDEPVKDIARLAVQEAWRQAVLIYFYMGMREVNSACIQVQTAVRQIVQLGDVVEPGSPLERHLLIPCLIAGVAARQEKHRASLRSKVSSKSFPHEITLVLRTSEFVVVLDHLWHGVGKGGNPVTWDDYVRSRCATIPITH